MIYIYVKPGKVLIDAIDESGHLLESREFYSTESAKKYYEKKYGPIGRDWKWSDHPWLEPVKSAADNYFNIHGVSLYGKNE